VTKQTLAYHAYRTIALHKTYTTINSLRLAVSGTVIAGSCYSSLVFLLHHTIFFVFTLSLRTIRSSEWQRFVFGEFYPFGVLPLTIIPFSISGSIAIT